MESFSTYILSAIAMVFVIEGLLYALFPGGMKQMMAIALSLPADKLRNFGILMAMNGLFFLWLLSKF